ncbi:MULTISPECIES: hypothetical protein [Acidiplasma]|jgi:ribosome-interacting GTPase 1|nr:MULTISPECIES: hypothetical protein [Acidiplasma]WMT54709.1 MAG: hypothetical protein RE470_07270 [Acidiplasma sp.]
MGLGKRDLNRKKKSIEMKIQELEEKARKNPLDKGIQEEINELKKKMDK